MPTRAQAGRAQRPLRRDARRNRELLLAAAREVVAEEGLDAPLERIADRAGLGIATLYRHFPTREALVDAIRDDLVDGYAAILGEATSSVDTWDGFCGVLERVLEMHVRNRGLAELLARDPRGDQPERMARRRAEVGRLVEAILDTARQRAGLRSDFTRADLSLLFVALSRVAEATADVAPEAWRRHLRLTLDGLHGKNATPLDLPPLSARQLEEVASRLRTRHRRRASPA